MGTYISVKKGVNIYSLSNIAEGCGRSTARETSRFIDIALGSIAEVETQLLIAQNLGYIDASEMLQKLSKINALTQGIRNYLKKIT